MSAMTTDSADPPEEALRHLHQLARGAGGPAGPARAALAELQEWLAGQRAREDALRRRLAEVEERCRRAQEAVFRYHELFEFAPEAHLVTDLAGNIRTVNNATAVLFGRPRQFLVGMPLPFLLAAAGRRGFYHVLADLRAAREFAARWEGGVQLPGNGTRDVACTVSVVADDGGRPAELRWLLRDVTERNRSAAELAEAHEQILQMERLAAIGQMAAGLAHDSRNMIQRSQACLDRLAWALQDNPHALDLVGRARRAQDDLLRLYEDVREYAVPIRLAYGPCDLAAVWRQAWADVLAVSPGRDARLEEDVTADPHGTADGFRLSHVFRNLFDNALDACPDPVRVGVACADTFLAGRAAVRVTVRDNGPGFAAEQRQHLFEPFHTTKTRGSGLGLAIARRIVEAHQGRIAAGDNGKEGAEIVVTLPRSKP
jgi:PAS domain S-box-containing protein